ncbi:hypothetical protein [Azotobacter beijerinckii]|uniref:DUF4177 domain-containing protein n=1 Tax=Azotobacter beijerinckii TaxID=170623 RepID=A0A1I4IIR3_9GAMM|nr:hypothetical protein [Azotobacter beijerinckii]SFL53701.1 hypothetical protein SAMN04244574_04601 [Azotobacter beijerinckii]
MQLHEAHEVKEVYSPQEANKAIQQEGWKLIAVTSASNPKNEDRMAVCYVLGKPAPAPLQKGKYVDGNWVPDEE